MDLVVHQMVELEEVDIAHGDGVVEALAGAPVVQPALAVLPEAGELEGVGDIPRQGQLHGGADQQEDHEDDLIDLAGLVAQQELEAAGAVQAPGEDGGQGEQGQADSHDHRRDGAAEDGPEAGDRQLRADALAIGDALHAHAQQNHHGGHGTDDDGVHEDLEHAVNTLLNGVLDIRGGMGHRSGTKAGLVGEDAAANALGNCRLDGCAGYAAGDSGGIERAHKDALEGVGDSGDVDNDHNQGRDHIDDRHDGHQQGAHVADPLNAAHQDDEHDDGGDDADHQGDDLLLALSGGDKARDRLVDGAGDGVDLGHVADAEGGQAAEEGEDDSQPLPLGAKAVLDVVHGAADPVALRVFLTVLDSQGDLGIFGAHAHQSGHPHPEDSAGAADGDSAGHTRDVAGTDGRRQSGTHGLEGGHGALCRRALLLLQGLAQGVLEDVAQPGELREFAQYAQHQARAQDEDHGWGTPDDAVDFAVNASNHVCHLLLSPFNFTYTPDTQTG